MLYKLIPSQCYLTKEVYALSCYTLKSNAGRNKEKSFVNRQCVETIQEEPKLK